MTARRILVAVLALASLTIGIYAQGGAAARRAQARGAQGGGRGGRRAAAAGRPDHLQPGYLMTGAWGEAAATPDSRGWGWMVKQYVEKAQRPLWNQAKEKLLNDGQVTSVTISSFQPETYCEARKHWDYVWFEMQHSTLSFAEVQKMIAACPGVKGAAPMIRMPDALEANVQKATDLGVWASSCPRSTMRSKRATQHDTRAIRRSDGEARGKYRRTVLVRRAGWISADDQRQLPGCRDARDAREHHQRRRNRQYVRSRRRHPGQQRLDEFLGLELERCAVRERC